MKHNLVFIGNYGNRNIGDDAILHVMSERYHVKLPHVQQYVFARNYPADIEKISHASPLDMSLQSILFVLLKVKIIIIGGGGIFSAYTGPLAKLIPFFAIVCKLLGKKVIFDSLGFYSTTPFFLKQLVLFSMLFADSISVRDTASISTLKPIQKFRQIQLVDDPAFELKASSTEQVKDIFAANQIPTASKPIAIISIKKVKDHNLNEKMTISIVKTVQWLIDQDYEVVFVPFCHDPLQKTEQDVLFAQEIIDRLPTKHGSYCLQQYYKPQEIFGIFKQAGCVIGMRFHSMIFALNAQVPLVAISYEEKCTTLLKNLHKKYIDIKDISPETLQNFVTEIHNT